MHIEWMYKYMYVYIHASPDLSVRTVHQHTEGAQSLALAADVGGVPVYHHAVPDRPAASQLIPAQRDGL